MVKMVWLSGLSGLAALLRWLPPQQGGDLFGISRTIDQAVYTMFNSAAVVLWRFNSALISMSLFSYNTQDWLTNSSDGGVWQVMDIVTGPGGLLGLNAWQVLMVLAMVMFGMSRLLLPFIPFHPVDIGKAFIYGVLSLTVIQQGSSLMTGIETWRSDLGGYMYQTMAARGSVDIDVPGVTPTASDPMHPPGDLDGRPPIRGWEAVSTSYFLVTDEQELNANIPPDDFRVAYCLYDPNRPVGEQGTENDDGCSPKKAWDEWDYLGSTGVITSVWGIELPISLGYELPLQADHPENRELGIRQAQSGVARLALGPVVALYPLLEANVSLMLAMSASILYLTIPIMLLFGFFRFTEPLVTRLLLRFIHIIVNTIILNGLVSLFLLLLINVSVNGSLSAYLGIVGVAVLGGYMLTRVAAGTLKETLSAAMSAVGGVWMTATTGAMGREAAPAARTALGAAKLVGAGAIVGAAGVKAVDMVEGAYHSTRSGLRDLDRSGWRVTAGLQKQAGQLPAPLARLAQEGLANDDMAGADPALLPAAGNGATPPVQPETTRNGSWATDMAALGLGAGMVGGAVTNGNRNGNGATAPQSQVNGANGSPPPSSPPQDTAALMDRYSQQERQAVWETAQAVRQQPQYSAPDGNLNSAGLQVVADRLSVQGIRAFQSDQGQHELGLLLTAQQNSPAVRGWGAPERRQPQLDGWLNDAWRSQQTGRGAVRVQAQAQTLFGEQLAAEVGRAVNRHEQTEIEQVVAATRRAAAEMSPAEIARAGQVTGAGLAAIRAELPADTAAAFQGRRGEQDLTALAEATLQREMTASPVAFREALATANAGQAGRDVPAQLGLDPVAAGPYFSALNRFAQVTDDAGLSVEQRRQLLAETQTGAVTPELRAGIEDSLTRQAGRRGQESRLTADDVLNSALALPPTLSGPELPGAAAARQTAKTAPEPASWEIPRMVPLGAAAGAVVGAAVGQVSGGAGERLQTTDSAAPTETGRVAAEIRQAAGVVSGQTPRMAPQDIAMATAAGGAGGAVSGGAGERLQPADSDASAESGRAVAAEIRQAAEAAPEAAVAMAPAAGAAVGQVSSDVGERLQPADSGASAPDDQAVDIVGQEAPAAQRQPLPAATEAAAATGEREPVMPLDAQDQAGAAAAALGHLQQQMTAATAPPALATQIRQDAGAAPEALGHLQQQMAAATAPPALATQIRQDAGAAPEAISRDLPRTAPQDVATATAVGVAAGAAVEAATAALRSDRREAGKDDQVSGAEVKAAALAAGGESHSRLVHEVGGPAVGGDSGGGVAAALRRGRTEDVEENGTGVEQGELKKRKARADDSGAAVAAATTETQPTEATIAPPGETLVSMQPYYQQPEKTEAAPISRDRQPVADQTEMEMDAAAAKAERRVKTQAGPVSNDNSPAGTATPPAAHVSSAPPVTGSFIDGAEAEVEVAQQRPRRQKNTPLPEATSPAGPAEAKAVDAPDGEQETATKGRQSQSGNSDTGATRPPAPQKKSDKEKKK